MLYSISDEEVQQIKISPGIMLPIFERTASHVHLKILSISFYFPVKINCFLTFCNWTVGVWNFRGKLVACFEGHSFSHLDYITTDQDLIISYYKGHPNGSVEGKK